MILMLQEYGHVGALIYDPDHKSMWFEFTPLEASQKGLF